MMFPLTDQRLDLPEALSKAELCGFFGIFLAVVCFGRLAMLVAATVANAVRGHV